MRKKFLLMMTLVLIFASGGGKLKAQNSKNQIVTNEAELIAALAAGGNVTLDADITVDTKITANDGTEIDLNDKTLYVNVENSCYNNVTIKNGNIVIGKDDVTVCDGYFLVNEGKTLVLNDVNVSSSTEGIKGYAVFHLKTGANLDLLNSTLNIADNEYAAGYIVYAGEATATVDVVKTTITGSKVNGIVHATTVIDESTVTLTNVIEHGINRSGVTIDDSNVTISGGTGRGITAQHGDLVITGNSTVNISDMGEATIELRNDKNLTVAETATVTVDAAVNNTTSGTINGTVTVSAGVAQIETTTYETLEAALNAATSDQTVTLLTDITSNAIIVIDKAITLDGNGKKLTSTAGRAINVSGVDGVTIKNLTIECSGERAINVIQNATKVTIDNVTATAANYTVNVATSASNAVVAIKGSTLTGLNVVNVAAKEANVTINGGKLICNDQNEAESYAALVLNKDAVNGKITATGVEFDIEGDSNKASNSAEGGVITIDGSADGVVAVAYISYGDNYYSFTTLEAAVEFAQENQTVTLIRDIELTETVTVPADANITIDLNGKIINTAWEDETAEKHYYAFKNNGTLTITDDNTTDANGVINARGIFNYGILTLEKGTINAIDHNGGYGVDNYDNAKFTMNGGVVATTNENNDAPGYGYDATPVYVRSGAEFEMNGGEINNISNFTFAIDNRGTTTIKENAGEIKSVHTVVANYGTMTISAGTFICNGLEGVTAHALWAESGTTTINGGTFNGKDNFNGFNVSASKGAVVEINGGIFEQVHSGSLYGEGTITVKGGIFFDDVNSRCADGYAALPDLNGNFVVGVKPTATVNNLGATTITAGDYMVYGNGDNTADMPLSFVMQFLADQTEEDMATSPFADWFADFVITFTGIEGGSFTADGCYLAGHYGDFGWVKVPVDGMTIKEGVRYPVMLGVGLGQKYEYICSGVENFKCALYLTPEIIAANPNIKVNLELAIVYNSQADNAQVDAKEALENNENVYSVTDYTYDADDFKMNVAKIGDTEYPTLAEAVKAAQAGQTITLIKNAPGAGVVIDKSLTIDFNGKTYTFREPVGSTGTVSNGFQILNGNTVTLKNGKLDVAVDVKENFYILIQNYANLTVENMTLDGTNLDKWIEEYGDSYVLSNNSGNVNIIGSTSIKANNDGSKAIAFDAYKYSSYDAPVVTVNTTGTIEGAIEVSATLKLEAVGKDSDITRVDITGEGQLYNDIEGIQGTVKRTFKNNTDGDAENDWYTIGLPFANHETTGLQTTSSAYALYRYDEPSMMWENVKANSFNLDLGRGYIYANEETTDVEFTGTFNVKPMVFNVTATNEELTGFNLIGNPFSHDITFEHLSHTSLAKGFYVLENSGQWQPRYAQGIDNNVIKAFQGALVQVAEEGELTINKTVTVADSKSRSENNGSLLINVANDNYSDVAYVSFNEGVGLDKIEHRNANIPMVYVPVDGKNYAVATMSKDVTEIPVSFEAKTMGQYTISVEAQDCEFATMTLIDRMTGEQTNLLLEDYTFMAKSNDNTERFVIRLSAEGVNSTSDNFAYISNNELYISSSSDNAVVEIYDVLGRPVVTYDVNKSANISTENFTNGIYIIRLVEENDVKVQKILID